MPNTFDFSLSRLCATGSGSLLPVPNRRGVLKFRWTPFGTQGQIAGEDQLKFESVLPIRTGSRKSWLPVVQVARDWPTGANETEIDTF